MTPYATIRDQSARRANHAPCERCGVVFAMDCVVDHDVWRNHLSSSGDECGYLCFMCMDEILVDKGLQDVKCKVHLGTKALLQVHDTQMGAIAARLREIAVALRNVANAPTPEDADAIADDAADQLDAIAESVQ